MSLWQRILRHQGEAAYQSGRSISYPQLRAKVETTRQLLGPSRQLVMLHADNSIDTLSTYLACLAGKHPLILVAANLPSDSLVTLQQTYQPNWLFRPNAQSVNLHSKPHQLAEQLALMLTTSGSTGQAKLVRLSEHNLCANAEAIVEFLALRADDRAITALPFAYAYGLSVINSHLLCGASITMTNAGPLQSEFWQLLQQRAVSQLSGVPYSYRIYDQLRFRTKPWPNLRTLTQAGGRMPPEQVLEYAQWCQDHGKAFYVMYGQTEATARMTYLPPELARQYPDSVGIAIPGGEMRIVDEHGQPKADGIGELCYQGPNVMLGYASRLADLALDGGEQRLLTGDLGYRNDQGLLFVTGRLKRQIKLAGIRWQLDELEQQCRALGWEVVCCGEDQALRVACLHSADPSAVHDYLQTTHGLHSSLFRVAWVAEIPKTASGKIDYPALRTRFET